MSENNEIIPGLESFNPDSQENGLTQMEKAMNQTIEELESQNLLTPTDAAHVQLCRELAKVIGRGANTGKTSAALAAPQLLRALELLPRPLDDDEDAFTHELKVIQGGGAA